MEIYEHVVRAHIERDPQIFLRHQPVLGGNWSCPDFIGINFEDKLVIVIEVSTDSNPNRLIEKIIEREARWFSHIKSQYKFTEGWNFRVWAFVREEVFHKFQRKFGDATEIRVDTLEKLPFPWN